MQRQVSPDRKVPKVYTISNLEALSDLIAGLRLEARALDSALAS